MMKKIPMIIFSPKSNFDDELKSILKENEIVIIQQVDFENYKNLCRRIGKLNDRYGEFYEVVDSGQDYKLTNIPISQTKEDTGVHTDSSAKVFNPSYISLFCHSQGTEGGESYFVDMRSIFSQIKLHDPDLLDYLTNNFYRDVITPGDENNIQNIKLNKFPILTYQDDKLISFRYMRYWIERAYLKLNCRNELNVKMLDRLDCYLYDGKFRYQTKLEVNCAVFFNNNFYPHGRTQYIENPNFRRKLTRVWFEKIWP